jgi:hypothetical protein
MLGIVPTLREGGLLTWFFSISRLRRRVSMLLIVLALCHDSLPLKF